MRKEEERCLKNNTGKIKTGYILYKWIKKFISWNAGLIFDISYNYFLSFKNTLVKHVVRLQMYENSNAAFFIFQ